MTIFRKITALGLLLPGIALLAGCMTPVTVETDPPGATVFCRGSGRNSYRWQCRGTTTNGLPVVFMVPYNAIQTRVVWPEEKDQPAVKSDTVYTKLLFKEDPVLHFKRP